MECNLKGLFLHYLQQLQIIIDKTPAALFSESLAPGMFPLATNARIAANFTLRGYSPLIKNRPLLTQAVVPCFNEDENKKSVELQILQTIKHLQNLPEITALNEQNRIVEKAGFTEVDLPEPQFIHHYILPNFYFHIAQVYAVARSKGVALSKGDFDGFHTYPPGFSFLQQTEPDND